MHRKTNADRRRHRFFDQINFTRPRVGGGFAHRALLYFGDSGRNRDDHAWPRTHPAIVHLGNEMTQHRFRHFEVRDDAVFQWTHRHDVCRRATEHALGFVAHREDLVRAGLHRHDRWFAQNDPLILYVNESVGRAEIDSDVAREPAEKSVEHELIN